jgi:hypothetical protein
LEGTGFCRIHALSGIEITFRESSRFGPFRGFVAREVVRFMTQDDHKRALAEIDQLMLNIDWSRLIKKRPFVSALELRNAETFPSAEQAKSGR